MSLVAEDASEVEGAMKKKEKVAVKKDKGGEEEEVDNKVNNDDHKWNPIIKRSIVTSCAWLTINRPHLHKEVRRVAGETSNQSNVQSKHISERL